MNCHLHTQVAAGSTSTFCVGTGPQLYGWGKMKASGDNTTYPQPVLDLSGWDVSWNPFYDLVVWHCVLLCFV